jgi:LysW-gamma-L-lysine carboxypeptidase
MLISHPLSPPEAKVTPVPPSLPSDAEAIAFVHQLVATPSVSGRERPAVEAFARSAADWRFETSIDEAGNGIATRRTSLSRSGSGPARELVLLGHIDTVPGDIPVRIEGGFLHGRGSVDAKGPLAAMLVAAARADLPLNCTVRVVAAVGEETPQSAGARHIAQRWRPHACIIGEPSGWTGVTLGYKGRLVMHATISLPGGHSAGPHASAGDAILRYWLSTLNAIEQLNDGHTGAFDAIQASIRSLATESDGLQDLARLTAGFRLPMWITPQVLEAVLRGLGRTMPFLDLAFEGHELSHASDRNDPVVRAISAAIRSHGERPHPKLKTGTADMNVVAPVWKCPIAAYGPGDSSLDHTPHEHLALDEYLASIRVLTLAIRGLLNELQSAGNP